MENKAFKDLDQELDIQPTPAEAEVVEVKPIKKDKSVRLSDIKDKDKDYKYARAQLYDIVEKMQESLNEAMDVAQESQHPRAFEVVFNGAKNAAEVVDKITDLHKKMKDLDAEEAKVQQNNTQNNIFMSGSTADLLKALKESNK